ncbi:hemolysin secretion protein D [Pseudomonas syringae]|uniref:Hemolysin secretion protein D n=1 Tax=Pseudomonas syringae TaxID=317 RepID=A0A1C7ZCS7_PSESX|nr:efflux RND transporter periplasmic adaptor subunit [Pseudomonas syringae]OCR27080.1 hemolysin secretion protein D [Pseudomonas syringae]
MKPIAKKLPIAIAIALTTSMATAYYLSGTSAQNQAQAADPIAAAAAPEVDVATPVSAQINEYQTYSGKLEAIDTVDVRPLVSGTITAVHFKDGAQVKRGDPLFTIDTRLYQAAVDQAQADVAGASARNTYAHTDAARAKRLLTQNAIAQRDLDAALQLELTASANLKSAQALLQTARVNLDYCHVVAPVSGKVSRAELTLGNVVASGATAPMLTRIVSISPIYAAFEVDEQTYVRFLGQPHEQPVKVALGLANESAFGRLGVVDSIDNQLNGNSGTIRVRARFDNPQGLLLPGMYAHVKVSAGQRRQALLINETAVGTDQDRKYVMVVDAQGRVHQREVTLGDLYGGLRIVNSGLGPDDRIIVSGMQRVHVDDDVSPRMVAMDTQPGTLSAHR